MARRAAAGASPRPEAAPLVAALATLCKRQLDESAAAGVAYRSGRAGLDWYRGSEYVITDEAGTPVHLEWYSDEFGRLLGGPGCGGSPCTTRVT
jgi:hypothetical protein